MLHIFERIQINFFNPCNICLVLTLQIVYYTFARVFVVRLT